MKKVLVALGILLLIGGTLGVAYALSEPPSKEALLRDIESVNSYSFTREIVFKQIHFKGIYKGTSSHIEKKFAYTGKVLTRGEVSLVTGLVREKEEFYINGTLVMRGKITVNLNTGDISGTITLSNGTTMNIIDFWKEYFGISKKEALLMFQDNLPLVSLRKTIQEGQCINVAIDDSIGDRILRGLGLKDSGIAYTVKTPGGRLWRVLTDRNGRPVEFTSENESVKVTVRITYPKS